MPVSVKDFKQFVAFVQEKAVHFNPGVDRAREGEREKEGDYNVMVDNKNPGGGWAERQLHRSLTLLLRNDKLLDMAEGNLTAGGI